MSNGNQDHVVVTQDDKQSEVLVDLNKDNIENLSAEDLYELRDGFEEEMIKPDLDEKSKALFKDKIDGINKKLLEVSRDGEHSAEKYMSLLDGKPHETSGDKGRVQVVVAGHPDDDGGLEVEFNTNPVINPIPKDPIIYDLRQLSNPVKHEDDFVLIPENPTENINEQTMNLGEEFLAVNDLLQKPLNELTDDEKYKISLYSFFARDAILPLKHDDPRRIKHSRLIGEINKKFKVQPGAAYGLFSRPKGRDGNVIRTSFYKKNLNN